MNAFTEGYKLHETQSRVPSYLRPGGRSGARASSAGLLPMQGALLCNRIILAISEGRVSRVNRVVQAKIQA
jgi:hypothetical protein